MRDLVLVPGLNNTKAVFAGVVDALQGDVRCHPVNCPPLDHVEKIADALLETLPERFALAGFSFGGYVALAMLERAPERVEAFALIATSASADSEAQRGARAKAIAAGLAGKHEEVVAAQAANAFHPDSLKNPDLMAARSAMVHDYGAERFVAHLNACIARPDRSHLLKNLSIPVLVAGGAEDRVIPIDGQRAMAEAIPGAEFVAIPGGGHLMPMEQPQALADVLRRWLAA